VGPSRGVNARHRAVRAIVPPLVEDRPIHRDIEAVNALVRSGALEQAIVEAVGSLA